MSAVLKEAFCLLDRDCDGLVPAADIPELMFSIGAHPTQNELADMLKGKQNTMVTYEAFVKIVGKKYAAINQEEELRKALQIFDRENDGSIASLELKHVLLNLSEKLNADEIDSLIKVADPQDTGKINIKKFAAVLCGSK